MRVDQTMRIGFVYVPRFLFRFRIQSPPPSPQAPAWGRTSPRARHPRREPRGSAMFVDSRIEDVNTAKIIDASGNSDHWHRASRISRRRLRCARKVTPIQSRLIGEEPHIPYNRPPLSKGFVLGTQDAESIELRPVNFYKTHQNQSSLRRTSRRNIPAPKNKSKSHAAEICLTTRWYWPSAPATAGSPFPAANLEGVLYLRSLAGSYLY